MMPTQQHHGYMAVVHDATAPESPLWACKRAALVLQPRAVVLLGQDDHEAGLFWVAPLFLKGRHDDRPVLVGEMTGMEMGDQFHENGQEVGDQIVTTVRGVRMGLPRNQCVWGVCFASDPDCRSPHQIPTSLRVTGSGPKYHNMIHHAGMGLVTWLRERWRLVQHPNPTEQEVARRQARHQDADLTRQVRSALDRAAPTKRALEGRQAVQSRYALDRAREWSPSGQDARAVTHAATHAVTHAAEPQNHLA